MRNTTYHPDIKELVEEAVALDDEPLRSLHDVLRAELTRRDTIRNGLEIGERLQFDTVVDFIRERTGLSETDALAMIRAHDPERSPERRVAQAAQTARKYVTP